MVSHFAEATLRMGIIDHWNVTNWDEFVILKPRVLT